DVPGAASRVGMAVVRQPNVRPWRRRPGPADREEHGQAGEGADDEKSPHRTLPLLTRSACTPILLRSRGGYKRMRYLAEGAEALHYWLEAVALFLPVVRVVVVAVALPEARLVGGAKLEPAEPLGALPEVAARHDEPERPAVLGRERLAVGLVGDERVLILERRERQVRAETLLRMRDDKARASPRVDELRELAPVDAAE